MIDDDAPSHLAAAAAPWPADPRKRGGDGGAQSCGIAGRGAAGANFYKGVAAAGGGGAREGAVLAGGGAMAAGAMAAGGCRSGGAYIKLGRPKDARQTCALVVKENINPAGGLVVLESGLVVIGDADSKCLRVFRPSNEGFSECGRVGPAEIARLADPGGAPPPLFEMRGLAARGFRAAGCEAPHLRLAGSAVAAEKRQGSLECAADQDQTELIEIVFADNRLAPCEGQRAALFRVVLRESEGEWQAAAWATCAHYGRGVGQVDDPGESCALFLAALGLGDRTFGYPRLLSRACG